MSPVLEQPRLIPLSTAEAIARQHYGIESRAERLTGERDENFRLHIHEGPGFVLKIANAAEPPEVSDLLMAALRHVEQVDRTLPCPRVLRARDGKTLISFVDDRGANRTAMLYTFLPGNPLLTAVRSRAQRAACGRLLARLGRALRGFEHEASHRTIAWDLKHLPTLQNRLTQLPGLANAEFVADFLVHFASEISPRLSGLRSQFVHNDFNARNIIVDPADESCITGIIDFGDSVHTALVADVAVGVIGQLATPDTADESIRDFVAAYCQVEPLSAEELGVLDWLIAGRIVQNVVMTSWHRSQNPADTHFDGFDGTYFGWRIELAKRLVSSAPVASSL